jgi:hypothetical protein
MTPLVGCNCGRLRRRRQQESRRLRHGVRYDRRAQWQAPGAATDRALRETPRGGMLEPRIPHQA